MDLMLIITVMMTVMIITLVTIMMIVVFIGALLFLVAKKTKQTDKHKSTFGHLDRHLTFRAGLFKGGLHLTLI